MPPPPPAAATGVKVGQIWSMKPGLLHYLILEREGQEIFASGFGNVAAPGDPARFDVGRYTDTMPAVAFTAEDGQGNAIWKLYDGTINDHMGKLDPEKNLFLAPIVDGREPPFRSAAKEVRPELTD